MSGGWWPGEEGERLCCYTIQQRVHPNYMNNKSHPKAQVHNAAGSRHKQKYWKKKCWSSLLLSTHAQSLKLYALKVGKQTSIISTIVSQWPNKQHEMQPAVNNHHKVQNSCQPTRSHQNATIRKCLTNTEQRKSNSQKGTKKEPAIIRMLPYV